MFLFSSVTTELADRVTSGDIAAEGAMGAGGNYLAALFQAAQSLSAIADPSDEERTLELTIRATMGTVGKIHSSDPACMANHKRFSALVAQGNLVMDGPDIVLKTTAGAGSKWASKLGLTAASAGLHLDCRQVRFV